MDPVTLAYYGIVCGCLSLVSARISPAVVRFLVGVGVGLIAAMALPPLRQALGL
jgi:hypothetical protein